MRTLLGKRGLWLAAVLCTALIAGAVTVWPLAPTAATSRSPSQATVAKGLAQKLTKANTPAKRYQALVSTMRALHVGVYKLNGKAIAPGAERSTKDLYVYDSTLEAVAAQMAAKQATTVADLAARLDAIVSSNTKRTPVTADRLRSALGTSVSWAKKHPRSEQALPSLLLRELVSRTYRQDLAKPPALDKMQLDSLQAFLVEVDFAAGIENANRKGGKASAGTLARQAGLSDLCAKLRWTYDFYVAGKLAWALKVGKMAQLAMNLAIKTVTVGLFNSRMIDQVQVTADGKILGSTHSGGTEGGQPIQFTVKVRMPPEVSPSDFTAKCGWLAGVGPIGPGAIKVPEGGNLSAVPVEWKEEATTAAGSCTRFDPSGIGTTSYDIKNKTLAEHGTLSTGSSTSTEGLSVTTLVPNNEILPGIGDGCREAGRLVASVDVQKFFGGSILGLSPNVYGLLPPKRVSFTWTVGYHKAAGYQATVTVPAGQLRDDFGYGFDDLRSITAKVCGSDPWATPWTFTGTAQNHLGQTTALNGTAALTGLNVWAPVETVYRDGIVWELQARVVPGDPPKMEFQGTHRRTGSTDATIEENKACGAG